ncbi:MAG: Flp family type IVb pilin [Beijerinckiaceae bacterium]|nr:Flp family type IVb pilin [Beijerinckiaceae bacterium]
MRSFACCKEGATAIEYGLIAGLIAVAIITAVSSVGTSLTAKFNQVSGNLT